MRKIFPMILILSMLFSMILPITLIGYANDTTYYVDNISGSDANDGLTPLTAWQSLAKVNQTTFSPNDKILFKAGGLWTGTLSPKGSGESGSPIIIDMYGDGVYPIINANGATGATGAALCMTDISYWEINRLELTNQASSGADRRGVQVYAKTKNMSHIYLSNLNIHDVKGTVGSALTDKRTAGIFFEAYNINSTTHATISDILVKDCQIHDIANEGIVFSRDSAGTEYPGTTGWKAQKYTNVSIKGNTIYNITKNAMIIRYTDETCIVEYNVCHDTATNVQGNTMFTSNCIGTIFQYNEGYLNRDYSATRDGSMYDPDLLSPKTVWQYSYSHDNKCGLIWFCLTSGDGGVIVRYNISQNDKGILVCINYPMTPVSDIYNNVFYIGANVSPTIIWEKASTTHKYNFYNNIIYNNSTKAIYTFASSSSNTRGIDSNVFYGQHPSNEPADAHKITADPQFVAPGTGGLGITTVDGYKLQPTSPCIDKGRVVANNGGKDYFGNTLYNNLPDIGAYEYYSNGSVNKGKLATAITNATTLINSIAVGTKNGNVTQQVKDTFQAVITQAISVKDDLNATQEQVDEQVSLLSDATTAFNNAIIVVVPLSCALSNLKFTPNAGSGSITVDLINNEVNAKTVNVVYAVYKNNKLVGIKISQQSLLPGATKSLMYPLPIAVGVSWDTLKTLVLDTTTANAKPIAESLSLINTP